MIIDYLEDFSIISGSKDITIKILNLINNEYQCTLILNNKSPVYSLLYLKEENILISAGTQFTRFWNLNNVLNPFIEDINAFSCGKNALKKLDKDKVIVGGIDKLQIISIKEKKLLKKLILHF